MIKTIFVCAVFLVSGAALGAQVIKVAGNHRAMAISQESKRPWKLRDYVCVEQSGATVVCGTVLKVVPKAALVKLDSPNDMIGRGDRVVLSSSRRRPAALMDTVDKPSSRGAGPHHDITAGLTAGTNYFFPMIQYQWAFTPHFAVGVRPLYFSSSDQGETVSAFAGMVTIDYYLSGYFKGLWAEAGLGLYAFSASAPATSTTAAISESAKSLAFSSTIGYQFRTRSGFNAGLAGGVQYIGTPNLSSVDVKAAGAQALLIFAAGWAF